MPRTATAGWRWTSSGVYVPIATARGMEFLVLEGVYPGSSMALPGRLLIRKPRSARRQAALLRGAPEELEALDFFEAVTGTDDWK